MKYLPLTTAPHDLLSGLFYSLTRPWHVRSEGDTRYHSGKVTHPDTGQVALALPQDTSLLLHAEATTEADPPQYLVEAGLPDEATSPIAALTGLVQQWEGADAAQEVQDHYDAHVGEQVLVVNLLPSTVTSRVRTRDEMDASGWFPEPEM